MIKHNLKEIGKTGLAMTGAIFSFLSIVLSFLSWDEMGIELSWIKILIFLLIILVSFAFAAFYICCIKMQVIIWANGTGKIVLRYGDIIKLGFPKVNQKRRLIVIPVNTSFDTILDEDTLDACTPLVSINSIHGKWLRAMESNGTSVSQLDAEIEKQLQNKRPSKIASRKERTCGKLKFYEKGTIAPVRGQQNVTYLLIAFSEFGQNNNAPACRMDVSKCLKRILEYYDTHGQGDELYITLLGTGLSRVNLSHIESLETMKAVLHLYHEKIHGPLNIVIYDKDKSYVSIFD